MKQIAVGILAHVDSGKTTLSEAMLYRTGGISKLGRVDHGDSFLDTFSLERNRGITIFSKQAVLNLGDTRFTLLDTPGHVDFSAETERTLQVLDYAILVISGTDGVQAHTLTLWTLLKKYGVPTFLFINKMDLDGAEKSRLLNQLKTRLSDKCIDFTEDKGEEFFEDLALCSEELLSVYENGGKIEKESITSAIKNRDVFPCLFGAALKLQGIDEFLNTLYNYTEMPRCENAFGARVFKIAEDTAGNRLTYLKVTGGSLKVKDVPESEKNVNGEKVNQIRIYSGEKFTPVDAAEAGTVCAVTGLTFTAAGDGLGFEKSSVTPFLEPVLNYKIEYPENADAHTILQNMRILEAEDPMLKVVFNERAKEIQVQLMGEIQLEVLKAIFKERFDTDVSFSKGNIIYKETIEDTVEGIGHFEPLRHYAEVHLILRPLKRGSGLVFKTQCKEDLLDKNWQRLILTHLHEKTHIGVLCGFPITDMEISLASGKAHPKHTEGGDFRQATYRAVRQGLRSAKSVLLEPIYEFTLEVPAENTGRALADIQKMSGSFEPPEAYGETSVIKGTAPVSEMSEYNRELIAYTHGKGKLTCTLKGYEKCHNESEVIEKTAYDCDADIENTADSVFCSHGAGYNVKWNEVKSRMHLPSAISQRTQNADFDFKAKISSYKKKQDLFALDKELMKIFEATYGPVKNREAPQNAHFNLTERAEMKKPKSPATKFDGTEYLLVDGYNVIFAWDRLKEISKENIDGARNALINILCNYQGYKKCEVIVVFDAYKVKGSREVEKIDNINIVYTKEAETADMYIEKTSHTLAKKHKVRVVTSDALEQLIILGGGALRVSSREFQAEVEQLESEIRQIIEKSY